MNRATDPGTPGPPYPDHRRRPPGHRPPAQRHRPGPPTPRAGPPVGPTPAPDHRTTVRAGAVPRSVAESATARRWRARLVALARVLAGGLVVLALVVLGAPLVLGGPGPGGATVSGHVVAAVVAVVATAVAAHPRMPTPAALAAGSAVPIALLVLLWSSWWA